MDDYKKIKALLTPHRDIKASEELRRHVHGALAREYRNRITRKWLLRVISLSTIAAILFLVFIPSGMSAKDFLYEAIDVLGDEDNIEMYVDIRTRSVENFGYIDINEDFVAHHIDIAVADSLLKWRIDKGERVATGNGHDIYTWMPALKLGFHLGNADKENVLGYLASLLMPREILENELKKCISGSDAEYKVNRSGNEIVLTVHAAPQGNFDNPYLLNTSVAESENIRRYVVDADSKRLKSATVSVISGNREINVLKISAIGYGKRKDNICSLAEGIRFIETENQPDGLSGLTAEEVAGTVLNAFAEWDNSILDQVMLREISDAAYREKFRDSRLVSIGRAFVSGSGNSIFVPYTLELRDGTLQRHNLAMQKTGSGGWIVVGGL